MYRSRKNPIFLVFIFSKLCSILISLILIVTYKYLYIILYVRNMTKTKLQKTSDRQYPYIYFDKLLIEIGFRWKKGEPLDIDYDLENKRIVVTQNNERKEL